MPQFKILIADDEEGIREHMVRYMQRHGFENILTASKGQEAIEIIGREKPDFAFLDISLADNVSGMDVLKQTRELSPNTKCIMTSAYDEYMDEAKRLGAWRYLKKPFRKEMDEVVNSMLEYNIQDAV